MQNIIQMYYLIFLTIIFFVIYFIFEVKTPILTGIASEIIVILKLRKLDSARYKIFNNLMLPSNGHTSATQIDHVVVSNYGIFCVETKSYRGWIFGDANQRYWTRVFFQYKTRFYNPLWQNYAHIKALEYLLESRLKAPIVSLSAFPRASKIKVSGTDSICYDYEIVEKIKSHTKFIYSDVERDEIIEMLTSANIIDRKERKLHNREVNRLKE